MIYEVALRQVGGAIDRTLAYKNYISSEEVPLLDSEYGVSPEELAVELSMIKFLKEYSIFNATVEVVSVKILLNEESDEINSEDEDESEEGDFIDYLNNLQDRIEELESNYENLLNKIGMPKKSHIDEWLRVIEREVNKGKA